MPASIDKYRDEIAVLCNKYAVRRLQLFGSAVSSKFDMNNSDLDFLVEFDDLTPDRYMDAYFSLQQSLQDLFSRRIDLITENNLTNPYFRRRVLAESRSVYAR